VAVARGELPRDVSLKPENHERVSAQLEALKEGSLKKNDFFARLTLDRQKGAVYRVGDTLTAIFRSDRDCYLKLYHIAGDEVKLLFPNRWHRENFVPADTVVRIPSDRMPFEYVVAEPLGAEIVKAVASTQQFADIGELERTRGNDPFASLGSADAANVRALTLLGLGTQPDAEKAEDTCVFTIAR
jgi:hypothetical protein